MVKYDGKVISLPDIREYWERLKPQNNISETEEHLWKKKVEFMDEVSMQNNVVLFLWNPFTARFLYVSDKLKVLSGLDPSLFTAENGIEFSMSRIHPDHVDGTLKLNQLGITSFSKTNTGNKSVVACMNYLFKNGNEEYEQILQRTVAIDVDASDSPLLFMSFVHYVGHIKKRESVGIAITTPQKISVYDYDVVSKCIEPPQIFSDHEKAIIGMLAEGCDTKTIAQRLIISPHTVNTHRRNLIKKTNCIDTTGVVAFAKLINLI